MRYEGGCDPDKLLEAIGELGLSPKQNTISWIFNCPRCSKKDRLFIRKSNGQFICFYCAEIDGFRGRPEFALSELAAVPISQVRELLYESTESYAADRFHLTLDDFFGDDDAVELEDREIPTVTWPWDYYPLDHRFSTRGAEYLAGRGVPMALAQEYGVRYSPKERRVVFPVYLDQRLVGWQKRIVYEDKSWDEEKGKYLTTPKVLSSTGNPRDRILMFGDRLYGSQHVILCEGPLDAMKAHLCGGNVATMGKAVSAGQIDLLRQRGIKKIYLALDPDATRETMRLVREFSDLECYLMHAPKPYKDLGAMPPEEVYQLFLRARLILPGHLLLFLGGN